MSNRFRDLEKPNPETRKDAVLMAAVSGLESLKRPNRQDFAQFSALFPNLFKAAGLEARRTASAALSRLPFVPDDIAEMIVSQPIDVAAPFISHYENLSEAMLARAIARHGIGHARAAARRANLSPAGLAALWALKEPTIDRALSLRGLSVEDTFAAPIAAADAKAEQPRNAELLDIPPLEGLVAPDAASRALRERLRSMATGSEPVRERGPQIAANRSTVHHMADLLAATRDFEFAGSPRFLPHGVHLERLARFATSGDPYWFATALADAMGSSFSLAERIMLDLSGTQLASAMLGLGMAKGTIARALETYFPHLAERAQMATKADILVLSLDPEACKGRLEAWQRADAYTSRQPSYVPSLGEDFDTDEDLQGVASTETPANEQGTRFRRIA